MVDHIQAEYRCSGHSGKLGFIFFFTKEPFSFYWQSETKHQRCMKHTLLKKFNYTSSFLFYKEYLFLRTFKIFYWSKSPLRGFAPMGGDSNKQFYEGGCNFHFTFNLRQSNEKARETSFEIFHQFNLFTSIDFAKRKQKGFAFRL